MTFSDTTTLNTTPTETTPAPAPTVPTRTRYEFKLICVSKVKKHALGVVKSQGGPRATKFTRVSEDFLIACEANLKQFIASRIHQHPTKGKTLT